LDRVAAEGVEGHALDKLVAPFAVAELGRDGHRLGIPGGEAGQTLLEARDDVLEALQVLQRTAPIGGVEDVALVVLQGVFDADDGVLGYAHGVKDVPS
jgi:hypothetical protein